LKSERGEEKNWGRGGGKLEKGERDFFLIKIY